MARTLEANWEKALVARQSAPRPTWPPSAPGCTSPLTSEELRTAWAASAPIYERSSKRRAPGQRDRKLLLRALIAEIVVTVDQQARTAALTIYWEGGAASSITVTLPRLGTPWRTTDTSTVDLVRRLAEHHDDATIAGVLARQGRRTGTGLAFARQTVLHKVQRGELAAVHVRHGRRSGLRIQVKPDQSGLFEKP